MNNHLAIEIYVHELRRTVKAMYMRQFKISQRITRRDSDAVERYLNEVGKFKLLTVEEEVMLTNKIRAGDQDALDKLITANLRFVVSVAKRYQDHGMLLPDLISEGNIGLVKAAQRFDPTKGFKFISYAVWWIRQNIVLAIAEHKRAIRLPGNQISGLNRINKVQIQLEQRLGRMPSYAEISREVFMTEEKVREYLVSSQQTYSLDMVMNADSGLSFIDTLVDKSVAGQETALIWSSFLTDLRAALHVLPWREQQIMMLYYGLYGNPKTSLDDMAPILKLSKERVRQLKDQAHKTLKTGCKGSSLADYFAYFQ